ncbi:MAG TPA: cyclase family protein [Burkholderiales bacterium]|nr:cyclase family protein [Burkholderiales bacterium]
MPRPRIARAAFVLAACLAAAPACAIEPWKLLAQSRKQMPQPPWPAGDERGMANQIGAATFARCAWHLGQPNAKSYELSQLRSNTMPLTPFAGPYALKAKPSAGIPGSRHGFNSEAYNEGAEPAAQATQFDALGHFAYLRDAWDGKPPYPAEQLRYYGGLAQGEVKPTPDSPLLRLGVEKAPPIVTSAVLLDAQAAVGGGRPLQAGELVTAKHLAAMLKAQGLERRGIQPGDVVYVRTGWGEHWRDPDTEKFYYAKAPGLAYNAAKFLGERRVVAIGLDTPFVDPVPEGMLTGKAGPAAGAPDGLPFAVHHHMLTQMGIHHIENAKLDELARDKVWTSCTIVLPLRDKGAAGSPVRPVAIGAPG